MAVIGKLLLILSSKKARDEDECARCILLEVVRRGTPSRLITIIKKIEGFFGLQPSARNSQLNCMREYILPQN